MKCRIMYLQVIEVNSPNCRIIMIHVRPNSEDHVVNNRTLFFYDIGGWLSSVVKSLVRLGFLEFSSKIMT